MLWPALEHANNADPWLHLRDLGVEMRTVDPEGHRFPVGLGILSCRVERVADLRPLFLSRMGIEWDRGHESDLDMDGYRLRAGAARVEEHILSLASPFLDGVAE